MNVHPSRIRHIFYSNIIYLPSELSFVAVVIVIRECMRLSHVVARHPVYHRSMVIYTSSVRLPEYPMTYTTHGKGQYRVVSVRRAIGPPSVPVKVQRVNRAKYRSPPGNYIEIYTHPSNI